MGMNVERSTYQVDTQPESAIDIKPGRNRRYFRWIDGKVVEVGRAKPPKKVKRG
jgi:hypothetical protein